MSEFNLDTLLKGPEHFQRAEKFRIELSQIIVPSFDELNFSVHNESISAPELDQAPELAKRYGMRDLEQFFRDAMHAGDIASVDSTWIGVFVEGDHIDKIRLAQDQINKLAKKHAARILHNHYPIIDYDEEDPNDKLLPGGKKLAREAGQSRYSWTARFGFYPKEEQA